MALAPAVQRLVDPLLATGRYSIDELEAGDAQPGALLDRFCLLVQYCCSTLRWHVAFNAARPAAPPEILLADGDEEWAEAMWAEPECALHPSVWQGGADPAALLGAVEGLVRLYAEHHKRLARDSGLERLAWEHTTFLSAAPGVELLLRQEADSAFLDVVAPIELQDATVALLYSEPGAEPPQPAALPRPRVRVLLSFSGQAEGSATLLEVVWPQSAEWRATAAAFALPEWGPSMCLSAYMGECTTNLEAKIIAAGRGRRQRLALVGALEAQFGARTEVDLDDAGTGTVTFMVQDSGGGAAGLGAFAMALIFNLSAEFPDVRPTDRILIFAQLLLHKHSSRGLMVMCGVVWCGRRRRRYCWRRAVCGMWGRRPEGEGPSRSSTAPTSAAAPPPAAALLLLLHAPASAAESVGSPACAAQVSVLASLGGRGDGQALAGLCHRDCRTRPHCKVRSYVALGRRM